MKMMTRAAVFNPLEREHHEGLAFAQHITQGLRENVSTELIRDYVFWYWKSHIKPHFRLEEDVVLPLFPPGNKLAQRLRTEHDMIRELIICLDDETDRRTLSLLADLLTDHIRFENDMVFPWLKNELDDKSIERLKDQLSDKQQADISTWSNHFWEKEPGSSYLGRSI